MSTSNPVVGIDAGTSTFEVSKISNTGMATPVEFPEGGTVLRSVVYFENGETPIVGQEAENMLLVDPSNGVRHWKRHMGSKEILSVNATGQECRAVDLLVFLLLYCKSAFENDTHLVCREAVISVPANYNDAQKEETIQAAKAAGFDHVRLMHEPTAAMFSRLGNNDRNVPDGLRIVVDVGGGTTDISLCEKIGNRYEIKATSGVPELGGMDFTQTIVDYCVEEYRNASGVQLTAESHRDEFADIWRRCEDGKLRLNRCDRITVPIVVGADKHQVVITKDQMRQMWRPLIDRLLQCVGQTVEEASVALEDTLELIPIGGGSQLVCVQGELARFFGRSLSNHADPIHAVANGAVLKGWEDLGEVKVDRATILPSRGYALRDVTGHALGIRAFDEADVEHFAPILDKGVQLPSCHQKSFRLREAGATEVLIEVYQGDPGQDLADCLKLGEFELTGLPAIVDRPHKIEIELRIDANGMLTATAYDPESGKKAELQITYKRKAA